MNLKLKSGDLLFKNAERNELLLEFIEISWPSWLVEQYDSRCFRSFVLSFHSSVHHKAIVVVFRFGSSNDRSGSIENVPLWSNGTGAELF